MAVAFTTVERVKRFLSIDPAEGKHDGLLQDMISKTTAAFEVELDRWVEAKERTEILDVDQGCGVVGLRGYPIVSVASVKEDAYGQFSGGEFALSASEYRVDRRTGLIHFPDYTLTGGPQSLSVTYTGGMGATTAAVIAAFADLCDAADMHVAFMFKRRDSLGFSSVGGVGIQSTASDAVNFLPRVVDALEIRKRISVSA